MKDFRLRWSPQYLYNPRKPQKAEKTPIIGGNIVWQKQRDI